AARGSGALSGFVDILVEMDWDRRGPDDDRRRRLRAYSRYEETPRQLVMELNADGTDYRAVDDVRAEEFRAGWGRLRQGLEVAGGRRTRREILAEWPEDFEKPNPATVWEWLQSAVTKGWCARRGRVGRTTRIATGCRAGSSRRPTARPGCSRSRSCKRAPGCA